MTLEEGSGVRTSGGHEGRRVRRASVVAGALAATLALGAAPRAWAESAQLAEAARLVEEADFERALEALEAADEARDLGRADVVRLLALRALVNHALRNDREIDADLTRLAALEPGFAFEETVPPALQARLQRIRARLEAPLDLHVEAREIRGGYKIDVRVEGDEGALVRELAIAARLPGGDWVRTEGVSASIPVRGGGAIEYFVQALGPGGAVLLEDGSEAAPRRVGADEEARVGEPEPDGGAGAGAAGGEERPRRRRAWPWALFGTGLAALVAGAVVAGVLLGRQEQGTQLGAPEVEWP